ncbi:MAG TPA: CpsD/CapB family tyrosine-protein kinase [Candidatus Dormibacteraeota bacterium]|jgi:Mrp family chromosome partitioning ATPase|nr:CpsD/CapB family tyrosine-protein kinase [Candidatus Dormibacteraeota bacterium]
MSRNFELLQNANRSFEVLQPEVEPEPEPESAPAALPEAPLPLRMEGAELDELTRLVNRVFASGSESPRQVMFTGTEPDAGSSRICARTAEVLASHLSGTVCVVDANLRNPGLHEQFGIENHFGLADALQQGGSIRKYSRSFFGGKLWLVSSGSAVENWQTLMASRQMQTRMTELRKEFDHVLVDIPPVNLFAEGIMLGKMSDGLILVLKAHSSRREVAQKVVKELKAARVRLLGAILNDRRFPIPKAIYQRL